MKAEQEIIASIFESVVALANQGADSNNKLVDECLTLEEANIALEMRLNKLEEEASNLATERAALLAELEFKDSTLNKQNSLILRQKAELEQLLRKHNLEVSKANNAISSYEAQINQLRNSIEVSKSRMKRIKNGGCVVQAAAEREVVWKGEHEKLRVSEIVSVNSDNGKAMNTDTAMWWEHDKGFQLLCVYNAKNDEVMICDPRNDNDEMLLPSHEAIETIRARFSHQFKQVSCL